MQTQSNNNSLNNNSLNGIRRTYRCTFCRNRGHDILSCNDERFLEFETLCANKCQQVNEVQFKHWLNETYSCNIEGFSLIKSYGFAKCGVLMRAHNETDIYINAITSYIYEKYRYMYSTFINNKTISEVVESTEIDSDNYYDIPELIDDDSFEYDMAEIMSGLNNSQPREEPSMEDMEAALVNDINSGLYFMRAGMNRQLSNYDFYDTIRINLNNSYTYMERFLVKRFNIETILEEQSLEIENKETISECFICFENYKQSEFIKLGCNHEFCKDCTKKALRSDKRPKPCCAYCRTEVTKLISRTKEIHDDLLELVVP